MRLKLSIVCVFIFSIHCIQAQELKFPQKINLFQYSQSASGGGLYGFPDTRIWGWSNNGKVAYSIERGIEGRGGQQIDFVIFDLIKDSVVIELKMDSEDHDGVSDEALYNLYKNNILNALRANNIIDEKVDFLRFPIARNNMIYNGHIIDIEYKKGVFNNNVVSRYKVSVTANNNRKIINSFNPIISETGYIYVCGYFLNPFENRALIIIAEKSRGFEGTELFYRFAGCHLGTGFN